MANEPAPPSEEMPPEQQKELLLIMLDNPERMDAFLRTRHWSGANRANQSKFRGESGWDPNKP